MVNVDCKLADKRRFATRSKKIGEENDHWSTAGRSRRRSASSSKKDAGLEDVSMFLVRLGRLTPPKKRAKVIPTILLFLMDWYSSRHRNMWNIMMLDLARLLE